MSYSVLPDTDVRIDFFRGEEKAVTLINDNSDQIILSSIVVAELYAGVKGDQEMRILDNFISLFRIIPVTHLIAKSGGLYKNDYGKSHGVGIADAIIAATAKLENADLLTLNLKHYPMIKNIKPAYKK